jgi:hypothetical protein
MSFFWVSALCPFAGYITGPPLDAAWVAEAEA